MEHDGLGDVLPLPLAVSSCLKFVGGVRVRVQVQLMVNSNLNMSLTLLDVILDIPRIKSTPSTSRLLLPSKVWRIFGLKIFSTVFLWIKNLEKNL